MEIFLNFLLFLSQLTLNIYNYEQTINNNDWWIVVIVAYHLNIFENHYSKKKKKNGITNRSYRIVASDRIKLYINIIVRTTLD